MIALLVVVLALAASAADPDIAATASALAGKPVKVRCHGLPGREQGHVWWRGGVPENVIHLDTRVCSTLAGAPYVGTYSGEAIIVLAHETAHASGIFDEKRAECTGWRWFKRAALRLGYRLADVPLLRASADLQFKCSP